MRDDMHTDPEDQAQDDDLLADDICPACGGSGEKDGETCPACGGTGQVTEGVGGG